MEELFALLFLGGVALFVLFGFVNALRRQAWPTTRFSRLRESRAALMLVPESRPEQPSASVVQQEIVVNDERKAA
jgi:hypothetical protein